MMNHRYAHRINFFKCTQCNFSSNKASKLKTHINETYSTKHGDQDFLKHYSTVHIKELQYMCQHRICNRLFRSQAGTVEHNCNL